MLRNQEAVFGAPTPDAVAYAAAETRATFIKKTYTHLLGAIGALVLLCTVFLNSPIANFMVNVASSRFGWIAVIGAFMFVSHIANRWALEAVDPKKAYLGLGLYVVAQAVIFTPLLLIAGHFQAQTGQPLILNAAILTVGAFTAMTTVVFFTGKDFSFLGSFLKVAMLVALGVIVCSAIFGFSLGIVFMGAMVLLACASVLYSTSNVLHHYRADMHVAASLTLFAGIALLFWYILQLLMSLTSRE